jgi:ribosomal protein S18 acetylase RimI-like enzyme
LDIRAAQPEELGVVRGLWEEFEREVPDPVGEQPVWSDVVEEARAAIADGCILLALVADEPVAFAWPTPPTRGVARLEYLHVRPKQRRHGIGRRLVHAAAEEMAARGATDLVLEVVATNVVGRATWEALGFELIEHRFAAPVTTWTVRRDASTDA